MTVRRIAYAVAMLSGLCACAGGGLRTIESPPKASAAGAVAALPTGDPAPTKDELLSCLRGLEALQGASPPRALPLLARACPAKPCFSGYAEQDGALRTRYLLWQSDLACTPAARQAALGGPKEQIFPTLVAQCGGSYYGLPAGKERLLSDVWYILQRLGAWLQAARATGDPARLAVLDAKTEGAQGIYETAKALRFELPSSMADRGSLVLPEVPTVVGSDARLMVWVGEGSFAVGAAPELVLGPDGPSEPDDGPAERYPMSPENLDTLSDEPGDSQSPALLLAGRDVPARPVLDTVGAMNRSVQLAAVHDGVFGALRVPLESRLQVEPRTLVLQLDKDGCSALAAGQRVVAKEPRCDAPSIAAAMDIERRNTDSTDVLLALDGDAPTVADIAAALDAADHAGMRAVSVRGRFDVTAAAPARVPQPLDKDSIHERMHAWIDRIRGCYESELVARPELRGQTTASFVIAADGAVKNVKVTGMGEPKLEACVAETIALIRFDKGKQQTSISYPFQFQPADLPAPQP